MTIRTDGMLPQTLAALNAMTVWLSNQGVSVTLADFGGFRTEADTTLILDYRQNDYAADVAAGRIPATLSIDRYRPIAPYGDSYHDYGAAFDLIPTPNAGQPAGMTYSKILNLAGNHAGALGLTWGGTFSNPDPRHFQLQGSLDDMRAKYVTYQDQLASGQLPDASGSGDITGGGDIAGGGFTTSAVLAGVAIIGALVFILRRKFGLRL